LGRFSQIYCKRTKASLLFFPRFQPPIHPLAQLGLVLFLLFCSFRSGSPHLNRSIEYDLACYLYLVSLVAVRPDP
jgi:hypothetical protein